MVWTCDYETAGFGFRSFFFFFFVCFVLFCVCVCVCAFVLAFKARTRINFLHSKWGHFLQSEVLVLWLCALSSLFHNMGVGGYGRYPLFVRARHVQRCVEKFPYFECVIHRFVLALNAGTNTLYTRVYIVSSLWMPGQVGGSYRCFLILYGFAFQLNNTTCIKTESKTCIFNIYGLDASSAISKLSTPFLKNDTCILQ